MTIAYSFFVDTAHLVQDIGIALALALAGGMVALRLGVSPIIGYLAAGLVIGPFTPGYRADPEALRQLADVGLVFLMFGVGLHFNLHELTQARRVAVPAGLLQVMAVVAVAFGLARLVGLGGGEALLFGMAVSVSSTVVLIRALEERGLVGSATGRAIIGWLIVQDLVTIVMLVLVPVIAGGTDGGGLSTALGTAVRAGVFTALILTVGARLVPRLLRLVGRTGSRELFLLSVVCLSLGIAVGAERAGTSLALGAFIAGVTVSETEASHRAASDLLPLRDAFAVLFFVSIGMLVDPGSSEWSGSLIAVSLAAVIGVKALGSLGAAALFGMPVRAALFAAAGLAQSAEFTFILAEAGRQHGLVSPGMYQALLLSAVVSIAINPLLVAGAESRGRLLADRPLWRRREAAVVPMMGDGQVVDVVIVGAGRVGRAAGRAMEMVGVSHRYVDASLDQVLLMQSEGQMARWGDAGHTEILRGAGVSQARLLVVAIPDVDASRLIAMGARALNSGIAIVCRAHRQADVADLVRAGATSVFIPEFEGAASIVRDALQRLGLDAARVSTVTEASRVHEYGGGL